MGASQKQPESPKYTRRAFIGRAGLGLGAAIAAPLAAPLILPSSALGRGGTVAPAERIVLGAIGIGPRGRYDLECMLAEKDVQFVAVCDVQRSRREAAKAMADAHYGNKDCAMYGDMFELLARSDIDAVLIATGDHWHALASILAAKAGKDVYSEKPCSLTIGETQSLADAVARHGRVFQAGTQRRSIPNFQFAVNLAQSGRLGNLKTLHASIYRPRIDYAWLPGEREPGKDECDWDRWLGPAAWRPYHPDYVAGGWRGYYDFDAGATILDWGAHTVDLCQWANQADHTMPLEYEPAENSITARYANGVTLSLDYLDTPFGNRDPQYHTALGTCPVRFEGDEGWIETGDAGTFEVHPASLRKEWKQFIANGLDAAMHTRNFFDCIKTRAQTAANPDIMRHSHIACHAAAIAWQLGRKVTLDPVREEFPGDEPANRLRSRAMREPWRV